MSHPDCYNSFNSQVVKQALQVFKKAGHRVRVTNLSDSTFRANGGKKDFLQLSKTGKFDY